MFSIQFSNTDLFLCSKIMNENLFKMGFQYKPLQKQNLGQIL
ncbi:hypothetical protein LEP1GSC040_1754 [Leptospira santarosai str. 2000030832]|nr:hypothetical protein LEP1GSC040_1754 [Leptospira santarosai str. 2000030832]